MNPSVKFLFLFGVRELIFRKIPAFVMILAISICALYIFIIGGIAESIFRYNKEILLKSNLTEITATINNNENLRFTSEKLREVNKMPGVSLAIEKIEIGVRASLKGGSGEEVLLIAEGVVPDEPLLKNSLAYGKTISTNDAREVIMSRGLFKKMGGSITAQGLSPSSLVIKLRRKKDDKQEAHIIEVNIVGLLNYGEDKIYLPLSLAKKINNWNLHLSDEILKQEDYVLIYPYAKAYSKSEYAQRVKEDTARLELSAEFVGSVKIPKNKDIWLKIDDNMLSTTIKQIFRIKKARISGVTYVALPQNDPRWRLCSGIPPFKTVISLNPYSYKKDVELNKIGLEILPSDSSLIDVDADYLCSEETLKWLLFESVSSSSSTNVVELWGESHVLIQDPVSWHILKSQNQLDIKELSFLGYETWNIYKISDKRTPHGRIDEDLLTALNFTKPTFILAVPYIAINGEVENQEVELTGWSEGDPDILRLQIKGCWLQNNYQIVLPDKFSHLLNKSVILVFRRQNSFGGEIIKIPMKVVGVCNANTAYAMASLVKNILLWQESKMIFNEATKKFESIAYAREKKGVPRAKIYAESLGEAPKVVQRLEAQGYNVTHKLHLLEDLKKLGSVLVATVVFFLLGCVLNTCLLIFISNMLKVQARRFEIGVLRAHGLNAWHITTIFGVESALIGSKAFLLAIIVTLGFGGLLRDLVGQALMIPLDVFASASHISIPLIISAFGISIFFSFLGVFVSALLASRITPAEAMRFQG